MGNGLYCIIKGDGEARRYEEKILGMREATATDCNSKFQLGSTYSMEILKKHKL